MKEVLGLRFEIINRKGYYLKSTNGLYKVVRFHDVRDSFLQFIRHDFSKIEFNIPITYADFMQEYYVQSPIKDGNFAKSHLRVDTALTEENMHLILLDIDPKYFDENSRNEMLKFLLNKGFTETIDRVGNFKKDCILYFKKISPVRYIVFHCTVYNEKASRTIFNLFRIYAKSEKEFLLKRFDNPIPVVWGFNLSSDSDFYYKELFLD